MTIGRTFADGINRASSTSVVTARSSASRTERPSPCSSSARTLARFTGPLSTEGRTRRVSLRLVAAVHTHDTRRWECLERQQTMTSVYTADRLDKHAFSAAISQFNYEAHSLTTSTKQEVAKKRTRRTVKHQRAIVGASLDVIKERRSQRPEARSAARAAAVKEGKEKKAAAESAKKAEKAKNAAASARGNAAKVSKQGAKGAAPKVQARTR
ncbi:hypothetical protein IG631_17033 [Alternaria alternata]|nr:hypothetical protein IG631_17033 [Alternaria alternata]